MKLERVLAVVWLVALVIPASIGLAADWPQFRGINRDGISREKGLLKQWPEGGPLLVKTISDIGDGFSSPCVADGRVFITGMVNDRSKVFCFDLKGNLIWEKDNGPEFTGDRPGSRSTPTIEGNVIYCLSGMGRVAALSTKDGRELWSVSYVDGFKAEVPNWGFSESLLIDRGHVICTPGGPDASIVALNKETGETVWTSKGMSDKASYSHPMAIRFGGKRQILTLTQQSLVGVDANRGDFLWRYDRPCNKTANAATPLFKDGIVFAASAYRTGGGAAKLSKQGDRFVATEIWDTTDMQPHHGNYVYLDGYIYGNSDRNGWCCIELKTGKVMYKEQGVGKGSIIYADGMFYCLGEKGTMGLVVAGPEKHPVVSRFDLPNAADSDNKAWAHPTISDGKMYLRCRDKLFIYNIKK